MCVQCASAQVHSALESLQGLLTAETAALRERERARARLLHASALIGSRDP